MRLYWISLAELFERMAFGIMLPLFSLYLIEHKGMTAPGGIAVASLFVAGSYLACALGGFASDRFLGFIGAAGAGAGMILGGFVGLALDVSTCFWPCLGLLTIGVGLIKPSMTCLIGDLYEDDDPRRDAGFGVFYLAINVGYLIGPLVSEAVRSRWGWPAIFTCAALCIGSTALCFVPAFWRWSGDVEPRAEKTGIAAIPPAARSLKSLALLNAVAVFFWLGYQQTSTSLALLAENRMTPWINALGLHLAIRPGHFAALHSGLFVGLTPVLLAVMARLRAHRIEPLSIEKIIWGFLFGAAAFALLAGVLLHAGAINQLSPVWLVLFYVLLSINEMLLAPLGLSLVTRLSPPHLVGTVTGLWFAWVAVGHGLAALLGLLWGRVPPHLYFIGIAALQLIAAAILLSQLRNLADSIPEPGTES